MLWLAGCCYISNRLLQRHCLTLLRPLPARLPACLSADNWSVKAIGRKTTGTGRMKHLKSVHRRFHPHETSAGSRG
jgi:hypothetical protein